MPKRWAWLVGAIQTEQDATAVLDDLGKAWYGFAAL
jgi:hypothetical protein